MDVWKNKPICVMLALLSALVVLTAGTAMFASDSSDADDPSAGVVYSGGIPVGTWTVSGTTLDIRSDNSTLVEEFTELRDYSTSTSPSITSVTVKGFTSDSILTVLSSLNLDTSIVSYVGDIPTFTKKIDGSTDYVNGRAPGTWSYDVTSKTITLTRGSSSDYRLIDYESASIRTIFYGYYFLDEAENAVINGTYKSGGNYIFHEFTALKHFHSYDHTSMGAALLKDLGWETIQFDSLESFPSDCLNGISTLTEVHFGNLTTLNSRAFQSCEELTTVDISSNNALTIGSYAFAGCAKLVNLTVNANTSIALNEYSFQNCSTLRVATFNTATFTTGQYVFNGDVLLQEVFMGTGDVSVGNFAFKDCTNLTKANLDHLKQATAGAFMNTSIGGYVYDYINHEYVVLPDSEYFTMHYVNILGSTWNASETSNVSGAFQDCKNLKRVQFGLPDSEGGTGALTKIGNKTFEGCNKLVTVDFNTPQMSGFLGARMFANCSSLQTITGLSSSKFDTLGNEVFLGCNVLTSIELSDNLKSIANSAFSGLNSLVSVNAGTALQTIGNNAFLNCSSLTTFTHGNSLKSIGSSAFKSTPLTAFAGGNSLETIGDSAFEGCSSLASFTTGPALTTIGSKAFFGCQALVEFDAGDNSALTTIGTYAFDSCSSLERANLGNSLTKINQEAFDACTKLTTVSAGNALVDIGSYSFRGCTKLSSFTCGNNLEFIRGYAFSGCTMLTTFTGQFTQNPTSGSTDKCSVFGYAFNECRSLANIDLGNYTLTISNNAFQTCESLTEFNLGTVLTTIGGSAFNGCTSLEHAGYKDGSWVMPDTLLTIGSSAFYRTALVSLAFGDASALTTINSYAFMGLTNLEGTDTVEGYTVSVIKFPDTLSKIDYQAFMNCSSLQGIYLSENSSIYYIGAQAFSGCDLHGTVTFTSNLSTLNYHAFYYNSNLEKVVFSDSCRLTTLGYSCFNGCARLAYVDLPNSLETIEHDAFRECALTTFVWSTGLKTIQYDAFRTSGITSVDLPSSVELIGTSCFYNCDSLTYVNLNKAILDQNASNNCSTFAYCDQLATVNLGISIENIPGSAFVSCPKLTTVIWAPTLINIGTNAFESCTTLSSVDMPDTIETIAYRAFYNCTNLGTVNLNKVVTLGNEAFRACSKMMNLDMGTKLTSIPTLCFYQCYYLENITFSPVLDSIGDQAFAYLRQDSYGLKSLVIPDSVTTIGASAFYDCRNLRELTLGKGLTSLGDQCFGFDYQGSSYQKLNTLTVPINLNLAQYANDTGRPILRNANQIQTIHYTVGGTDSSITDGFDYVDVRNVVNDYTRHPAYLSRSVLTTVIIDDGITSLGDYNLYNLANIDELYIPIGLKPVDSDSSHNFEGVNGITKFYFTGTVGIDYSTTEGDTNHWIGQTPWKYSTQNTLTVTFTPSVTYIGKNMFNNESGTFFTNIKNVVLDGTNTVDTVGERAFYNCSNLTSAVTLNSVKTLEDMCFYGTSITSFTLGPELITVGDRALFDMALVSITVDANNPLYTSSNDNVLYGQSSGTITSLIVYPAKKVGTSYIIPSTVQTVTSYAAYGAQFTTLTIPSGVYHVGEYAFAAGRLTTLNVQCAQPDFDVGAFASNPTLSTVTLPLSMETAGVFMGSNNIASYTFTGSGTSGLAADYYINNAGNLPWSSTTRSMTIVFSEGISAVDDNMFDFPSANSYLTSVTLPSTLVTIGNAAFRNCNGLTSFTVPDSVNNMGSDCLAGCTRILTLTVPISLNMAIDPNHLIGITSPQLKVYFTEGTGVGCTYSTVESANNYWGNTPWAQITGFTVTMNEGIVNTGTNLFLKAGNLFLPDSLEIIGANAFNGATVAAIDLKNVTQLGDGAFANCSRITSVSIPATLESYSGSPFKDCSKITTVTLPININYSEGMFTGCVLIANYTFVAGTSSNGYNYAAADAVNTPWYLNLANSKSPSLTFNSGIASVGSYMFYNCNRVMTETLTYGISSVTLPATVVSVGDSAFEGCAYMSSLTFTGQNIGSIGTNAFKGCAGLTSLAVGPSTNFGAGAFSGCNKIASLTVPMSSDAVVNNSNPVFTTTVLSTINFIGSGNGFDYSETSESGSFYQLTPWFKSTKTLSLNIGEDITTIGDNTFRGCQGLKFAITLPDNIVELANSVFRDCLSITTVSAPKVNKIGTNVFQDSSITGVSMPELLIVQDYAFYNCRNLSTATLNACTQIGAHAFQNSTISKFNNASGIDLTGVAVIGEEAFSGCVNITGDVVVSSSLITVGDSAFFGDVNLAGLSGSLTSVSNIGASAFEGCTSFTGDLDLSSATTVGDRAFHSTAVTSFTFSNVLSSLGDLALFDSSLESIATGTNSKYVVDNTTGALYQVSGSTRILLQYPAAKVLNADFTIAANVSEIAHYALYGAKIHGTLTIPSTMTLTIGEEAFSNAEFTGLNIPNTLPLANLFTGCTNISSYYFSMKNNVSGFPADYFSVNEASLPWHYSSVDYSVEFQSGIISLDANMFRNSSRLISLIIPTSVGTLGDGFIYGCVGLQSLVVPANLHMDVTAGNITTLKTLRLTVQGTAHSVAYDADSGRLTPWFSSTLTTLTIDSGVLSIGDYFYLRTTADIVLPDSLISVGDYAFYGSTTNSVTFSANLQTIGDYAFYGCTMPSLTLPSKVATIGDRAFADNNSLTSVTLPDSMTGYTGQPFNGCINLSEISVPITIDYSAGIFEGCEKILRYTFTPGTNGIGYNYTVTAGATPWYTAVSRSYNVSVTFSDNIKSIGAYMFYECARGNYGIEGAGFGAQAKFVIIPDTVTAIGAHAFDSCKNIVGFVFGSGIANIGAYAFYDCDGTSFTAVDLVNIATVGEYAFAECGNIQSVSLGVKLTALGAGTFYNCTALNTLSVPLSVNTVANDVHPVFENCTGLTDITFVGSGEGYAYSDTRNDDENAEGGYYQLTPWYLNQSLSITLTFDPASTITKIGDNTFRGSTTISGQLELPVTVKSIGANAFRGCLNITAVTLGNSLISIGDYAFADCTGLGGTLTSTSNLRTIGAHAFEGTKVTGINGNTSGIETVGDFAFNGCSLLTGPLELLSVVSVGERAFYGTALTSVAFGTLLNSFGDLALFDQSLESISVDSNNAVYKVIEGVLYRGTTTVIQYPAKMSKVDYEVPDTVTEILHYAFYGADISGKLTVPLKAVPIVMGDQAFSNSSITELQIPVNVRFANCFDNCSNIGSYIFTGTVSNAPAGYYVDNRAHMPWYFTSPSLEVSVVFDDGVTAVDAGMFSGFTQLTTLVLPNSVAALGADAFKGCSGLKDLTAPIGLNMAVNAGSSLTRLSTIHFTGTGAGWPYGSDENGKKVLWYYSSISNLTIDSGITSIGSYSYLKVSGPITLPDSVTTVEEYAFYGSTSATLALGNGMTHIGAHAFEGIAVSSISFPETLNYLGDRSFGSCTLLSSIILPNGLSDYDGSPFGDCAALSSASLPISIDYSAGMFSGCTALKNYTFTAGNGTGVDYTGMTELTPWYSVVQSYNNITVGFGTGINSIGAHMFDGCNYVASQTTTYGIIGTGNNGEIVLSSVKTIGDYAFNNCTKISGLVLGPSIERIGAHAFTGCAGIYELELASTTSVGAGAFSGCSGLRSLVIPLSSDAVVNNEDPVFRGCTRLNSVVFIGSGSGAVYSESATNGSFYKYTPWYMSEESELAVSFRDCTAVSVGANTFRDVSKLNGTVTLPTTIVSIGSKAFYGTSVSALENTDNIETVGASAFENCASLGGEIALLSATSIGEKAFYGTSVTRFDLGADLISLGDLALFGSEIAYVDVDVNNTRYMDDDGILFNKDRTELILIPAKLQRSNITLPDNLATIDHYAAYGAIIDGTFTIPASVKLIGESAFENCSGIEKLILLCSTPLAGRELIGANAFKGLTSLTALTVPTAVKLGGVFAYDNIIQNYTFTGNLSSGLPANYYRDNYASMPWAYATKSVSIRFEEGVGEIDRYMFYFADPSTKISSINMASTITAVNEYAFHNCAGLTSLVLPDRLGTIYSSSLYGCTGITSLTVPITLPLAIDDGNIGIANLTSLTFTSGDNGKGVDYEENEADKTIWHSSTNYYLTLGNGITELGNRMFLKPSNSIQLPNSLTRIGISVFDSADITSITLNNGLKTIDDRAFADTKIASIVIPNTVTALNGKVFQDCTDLISATLPITIEYGSDVFDGCTIQRFAFTAGLEGAEAMSYTENTVKSTPWYKSCDSSVNVTVSFAEGVKSIGAYMFYGCNIVKGSVTSGISGNIAMPSTLVSIGDYAFYGCTKITNVGFNPDLKSIGAYAFRGCAGLTEISLGTYLERLGANTFAGCSNVTKLTIPLSFNVVASDDKPAFSGCTGIRTLEFIGSSAGFDYSLTDNSGNDNFYQKTPWYFSRGHAIEITFGENIPSIGAYTFYECRGLNGLISLHSSVTEVGPYAFRGCAGISGLLIDDPNVILGNGCFADCTGLVSLTIPISVNAVALGSETGSIPAFQNSNRISTVYFTGTDGFSYSEDGGSNYVYTPWYMNRTVPITVSFADTVSSIGENMFRGCIMVGGDIVLPGQLQSVGNMAFYGCYKITSVTGSVVGTIGTSVFEGCSSMTNASLPALSVLPQRSFFGCSKLATASLDSCTYVGDEAFRSSGIRTVGSAPNTVTLYNVTYIGEYAFANSGLMNVYIVGDDRGLEIGDYAFFECRTLSTVEIIGVVEVLRYNTFRSAETAASFQSPLRRLIVSGVVEFTANLADNFPYLSTVDISGATSFGQSGAYQGLFSNCVGLTTVSLFTNAGSTRVLLPAYMFSGCSNLNSIDLSNVALQFGHEFENCTSLTEANLRNATSISDYAFNGCTALQDLNCANATSIGNYSFASTGIKNIVASDVLKLTNIGEYAFCGCINLKTVELPIVTMAETGVFEGCTALESAELTLLDSIPNNMFRGDSALTEVTAPKATSIGLCAFFNCTSLAGVTFPEVISIGQVNNGANIDTDYGDYSVFYSCNALTYVKMPKVKTIGTMAFYKCRAMTTFINDAGVDPASAPAEILIGTATSVGNYAFVETGVTDVTFNGLTSIGDYALYNCSSLTRFTAPQLTTLPEHLFNSSDLDSNITYAPSLAVVSCPAATTVNSSFHDCTKLTTVTFTSATTFAEGLFMRCTALATVNLMNEPARGNIVVLSPNMFNGCSRLSEINFQNVQLSGSTVDSASGNTFRGCMALTDVELPVTTQIPAGAFSNCGTLESVKALAAVTIGDGAFSGSPRINDVQIPVATAIGNEAFMGCSALANINTDSENSPFVRVQTIGDSAFRGCAFEKVVLGPYTRTIGTNAFANNTSLSMLVTGDALSTIPEGAFQYCPLTEIHLSSSVTRIQEAAFDWTATNVDRVNVYFNGELRNMAASNAFVGNGRVAMTVHCDAVSSTYFTSSWYSNMSVNIVAERYAAVIIQFDGTSSSPSSTRAVYGGRIVLPYYTSGGNVKYYSFAMQSGGNFGIFASESDYALPTPRYAQSGDAVPVYPLLSTPDTLTFIGYTETDTFIKDITVYSKNFSDNEMDPEEQTVHYGSRLTVPVLVNSLVDITDIQLERDNGTMYSIPVDTEYVYIGYNFKNIWLYSTDQKITVYFRSGDVSESYEVVVQSLFEIPSELAYLENPPAGYEFVGWWTNPDQGGERAVPGETKFLGGQTWYARFSPLKFTVSIISDSPSFTKSVEMTGPYKLFTIGTDLYYTDLNHTTNSLFMKQNEVMGYTVSLYFDSVSLAQITDTSEELVGGRTIEISCSMNYYDITVNFSYMGTALTDEFLILDWDVGSETLYTTGMTVERISYTEIKDGLLMPIPLHDVYTLSYIHANGERLTHTEEGYVLYPTNFNGELSIDVYFMMAKDLYSVQFVINDDASTVVNNGTTYEPYKYVTLVTVRTYECIGYEFAGYSLVNEPYDPTHTYTPALTRIMLTDEIITNYSKMCTISFYGVWKPITYTVNFDLAGYTGAVTPESKTVSVGDEFSLPANISRVGQQITGWHWIKGETTSTATYTQPITLEKAMIESYAVNGTITLQCEWSAKSYTIQVDPTSGTKQFLPVNNVRYDSAFTLWDIGTYSRAFMMFGGWSVGEEGTKYANAASITIDDEMASYGDLHNGVITFFFVWISNEYHVQYMLDGGEGDAPVDNNVYIVNSPDTPFTLVETATGFFRDGYTFVGWKYSQNTSILYNNTSGMFDSVLAQNADANGIVTFYAVWSQKEYKLSYNLKGGVAGSYAPINVMYGEDVTISAPTQAGYDFVGWRATTTATETGALTKGAQYLSSGSYRLWDGQRTINTTIFRDLCSVDGGVVTFEAIWDNATYSVSYDRVGGTGTIIGEMTEIKVGQIIRLPTLSNASKTGYTFLGWSIDGVNALPSNTEFTTDMVEGGVSTVVFRAVWEPNTYTVKYRYSADQTYAVMETTFTSEFTIPSTTRTGYLFGGWDIVGADSSAYWSNDGVSWYKLGAVTVKGTYFKNLTSVLNGTVTIDAIWTPIQYRIAYSSNGGTGTAPTDSQLYTVGDKITLKDFHVLDGTNGNKSVIGWSLETSGSVTNLTEFTEGLAGRADVTNTVILYASWVEGLCTVSIDLTGVTVSEVPAGWHMSSPGIYSTSVEYGSSMKDVMSAWSNVTLTKDGNTFTGWNYGGGSVVGNVDVTPRFEEVDMTILYIFGAVIGGVVIGVVALSRFRV